VDRLFDNEWILRGLALVLAVFLWIQAMLTFVVLGSSTIQHIPLHIVAPAGMVAHAAVTEVDVTVLAPSTLARLTPSEFVADATAQAHKAGTIRVPVSVEVPRGTRLRAVSPDVVRVHLTLVDAGKVHTARTAKR